jgi:CubicO group peptidase (beta-lactamase class C family)
MRRVMATLATIAVLALAPGGAAWCQSPSLPVARPETQAVSAAGLARLSAILRRDVDAGRYAGMVALLARNGRIVHFEALGSRDLAAQLPMQKDSIVRIYSMSKLVTSVAVLMLMEEGRFNLDDPVSRYVPELAHPRVFVSGTADAPVLADARQPITIRHLLTHTSGYMYGGDDALGQIYKRAKVSESSDLGQFITKAAALPLHHQPGEEFRYGISTDILGYLVQVVSGKSFGQFLDERICAPLAMKDTAFAVPASKMSRLAKVYRLDQDRRLAQADDVVSADGRGMESGGGGLFSTAGDYARFAQMLLDGGTLEGRRLLSRKTVELMTANHLAPLAKPRHAYSTAMGFGLGVEVRVDLGGSEQLGSLGQFGWAGAATTYVRMDPAEKLVAILMVQHFPMNEQGIFTRFTNACYAALE